MFFWLFFFDDFDGDGGAEDGETLEEEGHVCGHALVGFEALFGNMSVEFGLEVWVNLLVPHANGLFPIS